MIRLIGHVLIVIALAGCHDATTGIGTPRGETDEDAVVISGPTMGTRYTVKAHRLPDGVSEEQLQRGINDLLAEIDRQMSTWRDDSELSRFNASETTDWFPVSPQTAQVVAEAKRVHRLSGGAFDVTVKPLTDLWGFGPKGRPERVPSQAEIAAALEGVGSGRIAVRDDMAALRKTRGDVQLVLSAIAKGFAVDRVAEFLNRRKVAAYMVEIGGEVRTRGDRPGGEPWTIGIERPTPGERAVQKVIRLSGRSLATSGDYRNYYEKQGRRYSHTIDPRTGRPIDHKLASVTVVADNCMQADAMATALMVLGPQDGYNWAVQENVAAYLVVRQGRQFVEKTTPQFDNLLER